MSIQKIKRSKIRSILCDIFIQGNEYTKTSFSRDYIENLIRREYPHNDFEKIWKITYGIFTSDRKKFINEYMNLYLFISPLDSREEREKKFNEFIKICVLNKIIPARIDQDILEYRMPSSLTIFEELWGDALSISVKKVKSGFDPLAKTGARLPSGKDVFDCTNEIRRIKELGYKKPIEDR